MVHMGVRGFEELAPDGIGERMAVVLQGPAGDEKDLFAFQFLAAGLRADEGVMVVLSKISPEEFREEVAKHGVDCATHEQSGSLVIVDWYSYKKGRIDGVQVEGSVFRSSQSLLNLEIAITDATKKLSEFERKRAVLDVLSPALKMFDSNEVYSFVQKLRTRLRTENMSSLLLLEKGMHPDDVVQGIHQTFDGVIDIRKERTDDRVESKIGILFIRGISYEPKYTDYRIEDGQLVVSKEESEEERVLRMLKRQEELLQKDPTNRRIWFSRGSLYADIGKFEEALDCFDKVLQLDANHAGAWNGKANALAQLGRTKEATISFKNALTLTAEKIDREYARGLRSKESREEILGIEPEAPERKTRICPLCGAQAPVTAETCPECGTDFEKFEKEAGKAGVMGYLESMGADAGIDEEALEDLLEKRRERAADKAAPRRRAGAGAGLTNGLRRERRTGLVNGLGRVNGLVNGLANARSGLTNGLTNGSGFTNGLGSGRFIRESRRSKWKIYLVPLIAVLLLSTAVLLPEVPGPRGFGIDGYFEDWSGDMILDSRSSGINPNIDIDATAVEIQESASYVFLLVEVQDSGRILAGNLQSKLADFVRVFIDSDGSDGTGYLIAGTGADYVVQVAGRDEGQGSVPRVKGLYRYVGQDQADYNAWEHETSILIAIGSGADENKMEIGIPKNILPSPESAVFVFQTEDWSGRTDFADNRMAGETGVIHVTQESANTEIVQTQASQRVANLDLEKIGYREDATGTLILETLKGKLLGTLPASDVESATLVASDGSSGPWTGSIAGSGVVTFQSVGYAFPPGAQATFYVDVVLESSAPDGATVGFRILSPNDVTLSAGAATLETTPTDHDLSYVAAVPAARVIDGGFSDWSGVLSDGPNEPSTGGNMNVDIRRYDLNSTQDDAFFYLKVGGRMLQGTFTPQEGRYIPDYVAPSRDSDRDTIPDDQDNDPFDFDNDGTPDALEGGDIDSDGVLEYPAGSDYWIETNVLGEDVRVYVGPRIPPPVLRGEDTVRIYIDSDSNPMTGYFIGTVGADYLAEIAGKNGQPLAGRSVLMRHTGGSGSWSWVTEKNVDAALDLQNMEISVDIAGMGFQSDFPAHFEITGWANRMDDALGTRSLTRGDFGGYEAKYAGRYEARMKDNSMYEDVISISYEGNELSWGLPESMRFVSQSFETLLSTIGPTPMQLGGDEVTYEGSQVGVDSSITYKFEDSRIKESMVIREPLDIAGDGKIVLETHLTFSDWLTPVVLGPGHPVTAELLIGGASAAQPPEAFSTESGIGFSDGKDIVFEIAQAYAFDSAGSRVDCGYSYNGRSASKLLMMQCPAGWFAEATYPVTIDPTVVLENNAADEQLGYNVTVGDFNGDTATDIAVGAPQNDLDQDSNIGAVYIYYGGTSIDEAHDLIINAPASSISFGSAVAAGDVNNDGYDDLIVGDPGYSSDDGRAYLYWGSSTFDGSADFTFSAPDSSGKFGFAIATGDLNAPTDSYDDIAISAPVYGTDDGRAYVYFGNSTGNFDTTNDGVLDPESSGQDGLFGHSLTIGQFETSADSDEDLYIGEPWYDGTTTDMGRMYVFYGGSGSSFDTTIDITSEPNTAWGDGRFGYSIAVADFDNDGDDDAWVGAPFAEYPPNGLTNCGLLYRVNAGDGDGGYDGGYFYNQNSNFLGVSVAGGDIENDGSEEPVAGSRANANDQGRLTIYWQPPGSTTTITGTSNGDRFGFALAVGDVNDDGAFMDIVVGAPGYSGGNMDGAAFVYYGNADVAFDSTVDLNLTSSADEKLGFSLTRGDFNDDGYDDLATGAPYHDNGNGAVFIYFGTASGLSDHQLPGVAYRSQYSGELFGWNITSGDLNGDGYDDLLVGAPSNDESFTNGGRAYIFYGGDGTDMDGDGVDVDIESETDGEQFGWSVASGNVESTGNDDAIIGAPTYNTNEGHVYVYSTFTTPTETTPDVTLQRGDSESFGSSVAVMNYDEDSYEDILVGAPLNDSDSNTDKGVAFVYRGASDMGPWFPIPGVGGNITNYDQYIGDNTGDNIDDLKNDDQVYYTVIGNGGTQMWIVNFDTTGMSGQITSAILYVQYKTTPGYGETEPIRIHNGSAWVDTSIVPSNQGSDYDDSDDLYPYGIDSWSDVYGLDVRFFNPSTNKDVDFDYMALNVSVAGGEDANITLKGQHAGDYTGLSVAAGDFDGDSNFADDAVLGAPGWYQATNDTGAVYVYSGSSIRGLSGDGTLSTPDETMVGPGSTDGKFGWSIASANMTGDSYDDLIVGAPFNGTSDDNGAMYAFIGTASGFGPASYVKDGENDELFGYDVVGGEYVTGGYEDIAGGAPFFDSSDDDGRVLIENIPEFETIIIPLLFTLAIPIMARRRLR